MNLSGSANVKIVAPVVCAVAKGGFTSVVLMPSTHPPIQSKSDVEYLKSKASNHLVSVLPSGALSQNREGKDISEMYDMKVAGAVAFTDDKRPVKDSGLMSRALQYARNVGTVVMTYSDDAGISGNGMVNEGVPATLSGIKSTPAFAEELMVSRDIDICRYTQGRLHFGTLSTKGSMDLVADAKSEGLNVTADVCAHQLFFNDTVITEYDTNYKVKPPFRSDNDVMALRKAVASGTIDAICSDHSPQDDESKTVEFDFAAYGIAGIETAFAAARTACTDVPLVRLVDCFSNGPRRVLGLEPVRIAEGNKACLTVFHPDQEWTPTVMDRNTMAVNNPFIGMKLKGKVLGVVNNNQMVWFGL